jgi:hypothetical protein
MRLLALVMLAMASGASATPCQEAQYPAVTDRSLRAVLAGMARTERFDLDFESVQDAAISHPAGTAREVVDTLARRFNLIVQYRPDAACGRLQIARLWVLPVAPRRAAVAAPPPPPAPPDEATLKFMSAHGASQPEGHPSASP